MTIPIYSNLKAKLEAKGLDARTSGQIAWFVCSVAIAHIIFMCLFIYNVSIDHIEDIIKAIIYVYLNHFFLFAFMFFILFLNLLYIKNTLLLLWGFFMSFWILKEFTLISILIFFISSITFIKIKKYRIFWIYLIGVCYYIVMFQIADKIQK